MFFVGGYLNVMYIEYCWKFKLVLRCLRWYFVSVEIVCIKEFKYMLYYMVYMINYCIKSL